MINPGTAPAQDDPVKETNTSQFQADVVDASMTTPVIVDFWAPWCGPCKQLGPLLEKTVRAAGGKVRLVKLNIDENQQLAAQLRIQSIPTVYAFFQGRPVDGFQGAQPESQIKQLVDKLSQMGGGQEEDPVADALAQADEAFADGNAQAAGGIYQQILQHDPENSHALGGMAKALIKLGHTEQARELLSQASGEMAKAEPVTAAWSALEMAERAAAAAEHLPALEQAIATNPDDHASRYDLALALFGDDRREEAVDHLLEIIRRDRDWNEQAARLELLKMFEAMGSKDPLTAAARRKLSTILFS